MDDPGEVMIHALNLIERHEGYSQFPIPDAQNTIQIGYGTNLTRRGIDRAEADYLARGDIARLMNWFSSFPWYSGLSLNRKVALIDLAYDVGRDGFEHFRRMLGYLEVGNFDKAADEMLDSRTHEQTGTRLDEDAALMRRG